MAIISINLGVINLFPIPVLDGGHIMFLAFETINRGPLSRRKLEIAQRFGISILFLLIFVALFNDITRLF
jgi:regulator of sigma E protease